MNDEISLKKEAANKVKKSRGSTVVSKTRRTLAYFGRSIWFTKSRVTNNYRSWKTLELENSKTRKLQRSSKTRKIILT